MKNPEIYKEYEELGALKYVENVQLHNFFHENERNPSTNKILKVIYYGEWNEELNEPLGIGILIKGNSIFEGTFGLTNNFGWFDFSEYQTHSY